MNDEDIKKLAAEITAPALKAMTDERMRDLIAKLFFIIHGNNEMVVAMDKKNWLLEQELEKLEKENEELKGKKC